MAESQVIDWLQENSFRAYPLRNDVSRTANTGYVLKEDVIVDALLVYSTPTTNVALVSIVADATNVVFNVTGQSFTVARTSAFPAYLRLTNGSLLVVNRVVDIPDGTHTFTNLYFEKAVVVEFGAEWLGVSTLQFDSSSPLTGAITCKEGYQFGLDFSGSTIDLWADRSRGTPLGCFSLGTFNDCDNIVSYVNGVGPNRNHVLKFSRGNNIILLEDPTNHRIFIGLTFAESDICKAIPTNPEL